MESVKGMVSIIVPVYNGDKYLARCIDSLVSQTYKDIEIIIIDDGSKDDSAKIAQDYAEKDQRITLLTKENSGVSDARNIGMDKAKEKANGSIVKWDCKLKSI